jgi:hypothetical protein
MTLHEALCNYPRDIKTVTPPGKAQQRGTWLDWPLMAGTTPFLGLNHSTLPCLWPYAATLGTLKLLHHQVRPDNGDWLVEPLVAGTAPFLGP